MSDASLKALCKETKALIIVSEFEARRMPMFQMRAVFNAIIINDKVELCDYCKYKSLRKSRYLVIPNVDFILKKYLGFSEIYYRIFTDSRFFCDGLSTNQIKKIFCEMVDCYRSEMSDTVWKYYIWNQVSDKLDRDRLVYSNNNEIPEDIIKSILPFK